MNTINTNSMVHVAMDGQSLYNINKNTAGNTVQQAAAQSITPTGAQVAQNIEQNMAELKADIQALQKMTEMVGGNKLQFSVNKELGSVVVSIVDSATNQVIKQIPSEDMQKLKLRIRKAIGSMFDEVI
ncbi:MAG: flagellar protein FlaG [Treponema sp.]|nr:flagellar protein FlaG [Treponema sp.]MCI6592624.1 flagellar protein FlaG [Spirochaetia bacterium]MDD7533382.1 flagellar protein FlaG [Treponema sp.]MDY5757763.1 flagellar protein FlaG [Treponema sp.]MDY5819485.1 flagellar protein FlaG [Treponema sp.]